VQYVEQEEYFVPVLDEPLKLRRCLFGTLISPLWFTFSNFLVLCLPFPFSRHVYMPLYSYFTYKVDWGDRTLSEELPIFEDVVIPKTELYMRKRIDDRIDIAIEV